MFLQFLPEILYLVDYGVCISYTFLLVCLSDLVVHLHILQFYAKKTEHVETCIYFLVYLFSEN